jgi:hypothetical protein
MLCLGLTLQGCEAFVGNVRPLGEYQHQSHFTQHIGSDRTNYGYDVYSVGVRYRPDVDPRLTVDVLEGYSLQSFQGRREVFTFRVTKEF